MPPEKDELEFEDGFEPDTDDDGDDPAEEEEDGEDLGGEPAKPVEKPAAKAPKDDGELKSLRARAQEAEADAKYWREQAKEQNERGGKAKPAAKEDEEEEIELSEDLSDIVTSNDPKKLKSVLSKKLGLVDRKEVERMLAESMQRTVKAATEGSQLYEEYPELRNTKGDFFKATNSEYLELCKEHPELKGSATLMRLAAKSVDSERKATAKRESGRAERIGRQSGDRSVPGSHEEGSELSDRQRAIVRSMRAVGVNITEDAYRKRATKGVNVSPRMQRRSGR